MPEAIFLSDKHNISFDFFVSKTKKAYDLAKAKEALAETKERIGNDHMLELYKSKIEESNEMWREIAEKSPAIENLQPCIVAVEVRGITIEEVMDFMKSVYEAGKISMLSKINPELYFCQRKHHHR